MLKPVMIVCCSHSECNPSVQNILLVIQSRLLGLVATQFVLPEICVSTQKLPAICAPELDPTQCNHLANNGKTDKCNRNFSSSFAEIYWPWATVPIRKLIHSIIDQTARCSRSNRIYFIKSEHMFSV